MGDRVNRTLLNWRWWASLPLLLLILPAVLVDLPLAALVTTGDEARKARRALSRASARVLDPLDAWMYQRVANKRPAFLDRTRTAGVRTNDR